jgi:hypothetical protein
MTNLECTYTDSFRIATANFLRGIEKEPEQETGCPVPEGERFSESDIDVYIQLVRATLGEKQVVIR